MRRPLNLALAHPPFRAQSRLLNQKWNRIYRRPVLTAAKLEESPMVDIEAEIRKAWSAVLAGDLPVIRQVIRSGGFGIEAPGLERSAS